MLSAFTNLLNCLNDIGVRTATTDVAAHQFLYRGVIWTAWFFEQRNR